MSSVESRLFDRWKTHTLAHFYLVIAPSERHSPRTFLSDWMIDFLSTILVEEKWSPSQSMARASILGHECADILWIGDTDDESTSSSDDDSSGPGAEKSYLAENFSDFFQFLNYRPLELSQRFVVIHDAHRLSTTVANKLLKSLEEPTPKTSIFLLHHSGQELLPTIRSRAIGLRPTPEQSLAIDIGDLKPDPSQDELILWIERSSSKGLAQSLSALLSGQTGLADVIEKIRKHPERANELIQLVLQVERQRMGNGSGKQRFLNELEWMQKSAVYNNAPSERLAHLLQTLMRRP